MFKVQAHKFLCSLMECAQDPLQKLYKQMMMEQDDQETSKKSAG